MKKENNLKTFHIPKFPLKTGFILFLAIILMFGIILIESRITGNIIGVFSIQSLPTGTTVGGSILNIIAPQNNSVFTNANIGKLNYTIQSNYWGPLHGYLQHMGQSYVHFLW